MTKMSDEKVRQVFKDANDKLSQFYLERMSIDWVKHFGGEVELVKNNPSDPEAMKHLRTRVESGMSQVGL